MSADPADTVELLTRARGGDRDALDRLFARHAPLLRRWASGRLPPWARDIVETTDLVQDTMLETFKHLDGFEPRGDGALQAYLRRAVMNRVRNQLRRMVTRPGRDALNSGLPAENPSPLEAAIGSETLARYERGLARLDADERAGVVARVELGLTYAEIADLLEKPSADAARMAVVRALMKLSSQV